MTHGRGLFIGNVLWICAWLAAAFGAVLKAGGVNGASGITSVCLLAILPAIISLVLSRYSQREWVQAVIVMVWVGFAIMMSYLFGFNRLGFVFLCAPMVAALFQREKIIEAIALSAFGAFGLLAMQSFGAIPERTGFNIFQILSDQTNSAEANSFIQHAFAGLASKYAVAALLIGTLFALASRNDTPLGYGADSLSTNHYKGLSGKYPGAVLKLDAAGNIVEASQLAFEALGLSEHDNGAVNLSQFFQPHDRSVNNSDVQQGSQHLLSRISNILSSAKGRKEDPINGEDNFIVSMVMPNLHGATQLDQTKHMEFNVQPLDENHVLAFLTDRTKIMSKMKTLELAQEKAAKEFSEKTLFFAGVSHELRTPLNAIIGFSDMMRSRLFGPLPGKYAEYANLIHDSGQHMLDLIGDVLDLSKVDAGKYELVYDQFDMSDVIRSSLKMIRPAADAGSVQVLAEIDVHDNLNIEADRRAVRQILLNLLSNAIKFTPKGGAVTIKAKIVGDVLDLSVEDNGMGMSDQDLKKIGTAYLQTSNTHLVDSRSTGLGLALVKNLVDLHKGRISFTSHPGAGTSVNIFLPIHQQ